MRKKAHLLHVAGKIPQPKSRQQKYTTGTSTQILYSMMAWLWANVEDGDPALGQHWVNIHFLLCSTSIHMSMFSLCLVVRSGRWGKFSTNMAPRDGFLRVTSWHILWWPLFGFTRCQWHSPVELPGASHLCRVNVLRNIFHWVLSGGRIADIYVVAPNTQ